MATCSTGDRLGQYSIEEVLAANHRYECYRARACGEQFVLKIPAAANPHRGSILQDLEAQARFLSPARCPIDRIAHYLELLPVVGSVAIVMRYFEGRSLAALLGDASWTEHARWRFLRCLAGILDELHDFGVGHRDLSDSNVLVDPAGMPVLIDFELASTIPVTDDRQISLVSGNRFYKSPEQWTGLPQDAGVDVFAFALLSLYVLSRRRPEQESRALVDSPASALGLPLGMAQHLAAALVSDPARRPRSCLGVLGQDPVLPVW